MTYKEQLERLIGTTILVKRTTPTAVFQIEGELRVKDNFFVVDNHISKYTFVIFMTQDVKDISIIAGGSLAIFLV